ncbi:MAG: flagellar basal body P-ring protein FlgI [Phycisphaeraceae bacterium]|nr:flagellar basal body P-ring protein FlgI [Phycisphaeraceae bacterium]
MASKTATTRRLSQTATIAACVVVMALTVPAGAVQVQDLVRIKGSESSKLVGMGLVCGLNGTGDGGKFAPAMRSLARVVERLAVGGTIADELKDSKNVALVALSATVPAEGVREGDQIDVHVSTIGPCKSLAGGRLFLIPMTGPLPGSDIFAFAEGPLTIEDAKEPNTALVKRGAQMVRDIRAKFLDEAGRVTLIVDDKIASWPTASNLANHINSVVTLDDGPQIATAVDPRNVVVNVPTADRANPGPFLTQILTSYIDPPMIGTGARVKINEKTGTIVFGADVQISPVVISHKGLTITTITPEPQPTPQQPAVDESAWIAVDPEHRGGARLSDLLSALKQLRVEAADRIEIIKELDRIGKLHAKLIIE